MVCDKIVSENPVTTVTNILVNPHVMLDKYEFQNYLHENQDRLNIIIHGNGTVSPCIVNWREKCDQIFSDLKQRSLLDETPFTVRVLQHHKELQLLAKMTNKVYDRYSNGILNLNSEYLVNSAKH